MTIHLLYSFVGWKQTLSCLKQSSADYKSTKLSPTVTQMLASKTVETPIANLRKFIDKILASFVWWKRRTITSEKVSCHVHDLLKEKIDLDTYHFKYSSKYSNFFILLQPIANFISSIKAVDFLTAELVFFFFCSWDKVKSLGLDGKVIFYSYLFIYLFAICTFDAELVVLNFWLHFFPLDLWTWILYEPYCWHTYLQT